MKYQISIFETYYLIKMRKITILSLLLLGFLTLSAQRGKDGNKTITAAATVVNEYTALTADASAGETTITVANNSLNTNNRFPANLAAGDLVMIIQMQGATIDFAPDDATYGAVTNLNNCGNYELLQVKSVSGSTQITFDCALVNNYTAAGKVQVVRIPRYNTLTVNANADITCPAWSGTTGGVLALEVLGNTTINANGKIAANGKGFRSGKSNENQSAYGVLNYRSLDAQGGGEKGEGIAGYVLEYDNMNGRYGRGAPANGGGGGNGHNCGGGGGANGGDTTGWRGTGIPDVSNTNWAQAWELEGPGFSTSVSVGGGKGGYSFSANDQNALTTPLYNSAWGGDWRHNMGGLGGRPVSPQITTRAFLGGGGGAGDQNDGTAGDGGNGGGFIYVQTYGQITGGGSVEANGADGENSGAGFTTGKDGAGGGGGGGTIIVKSTATITNLTFNANGGKGGNLVQLFGVDTYGTGGGGGGGRIATSPGTYTVNVLGGANGTSSSPAVIEFPPNGATRGMQGVSTNTLTSFDLTATNDTACDGQQANLLASVLGTLPNGYTIQWVDTANGGSVVGTGTSLQYTANPPQTLFVGTCPGTFTIPVQIIGGIGPTAAFAYADSGAYVAWFTNNSVNGTSYFWTFGDGGTSTDANPVHNYNSDGTYTVTLIVTNDCGSDTIVQSVYVAKTGLNNNPVQSVKIIPGADFGTYYIDLGTNTCQNFTFMVNDISGRTLQQGALFYSGSGFAGPVNISGYSAGMYLLSLHCQSKVYYAKLIVR